MLKDIPAAGIELQRMAAGIMKIAMLMKGEGSTALCAADYPAGFSNFFKYLSGYTFE